MVLLLLVLYEEAIDMNPTISLKSFGPYLITRDGRNRFHLVLDPTEYETKNFSIEVLALHCNYHSLQSKMQRKNQGVKSNGKKQSEK